MENILIALIFAVVVFGTVWSLWLYISLSNSGAFEPLEYHVFDMGKLDTVVSEMETIIRDSIRPTEDNLSLLSEYELHRLASVYGIETKDLTRDEICDKIVTYFS
jgi:hypothetical protein